VIRTRSEIALVALAAALLGGCGGGGGGSSTAASAPPPPTTATSPAPAAPTATTTTPAPTTTAPKPPTTQTEPQQSPGEGNGTAGGGGGGGTEPARTELTFSGTSAGVTPKRAGVASYISVKVSLVSKDGSPHTLVIDGHTAKVGGTTKSAFFTLPGLRPGKIYTGTADGNPIKISATSEPGP
jgi:hypothetical protein